MLGRRILRIKTFKAIYSYAENRDMTLPRTEALIELSCEATRDLYLFMLSLVGPLTAEAQARIDAGLSKFNPSEQERHPNLKFARNGIATLLGQDPDFQKIIKKKKLSWDQYDVFLRHLFDTVREQPYFRKYMDSPDSSLKEDAALFSRIYENHLMVNPELQEILEDLSIYWNDDLSYASTWCCRTFDELGAGRRWNLPPLYMSQLGGSRENDHEFVSALARGAYLGFDRISDAVAELTPRWKRDHLCMTDLALLACGVAEAEAYPDTPVGIIINEYVEISKYYSTPESSAFVNGLLDKLIKKQ